MKCVVVQLNVFSVLKNRLCKFEAEGQQFVTFLRNFPYSRELKKQIINVPVVLIYLLQLYFPEKSSLGTFVAFSCHTFLTPPLWTDLVKNLTRKP